tara:strand:+ start:253 stop:495 length:243 start_codon:yes stop_codon:yes gene_type:complete
MKITMQRLREIIKEELALEEEGAKPLPGSRVRRKSDGKIGYRTSGTKTGKGSKFWDIKWAGEPVEKNVPRADFESIKDAE